MDKPLIKHVIDVVCGVVDEVLIVVSSKDQAENLAEVAGSKIRIMVDANEGQTPLVGAFTGFGEACGKYSLLSPCDTPLISREVTLFLLELCKGKKAVVPRWPNGNIEPLQSVYQTKSALKASKSALDEGRLDMRSMIDRLRGVRYVSTFVLQRLDPKLRTFLNVNSPRDLRKAESILNSPNSNTVS